MNNLDNKNLEIRFGGNLHQIDVDLLIESLVSYSAVTQEISAYLSPGIKVDIKIKAPQQGSFIILLDIVAQSAKNLFTRDNIALASEIATVAAGLYGFKKWIAKNGKPEKIEPKDDHSIEIVNSKGNITISNNVYNIYQENPRVRENLRKTFSKLQDSGEISDFSIKDVDLNKDIFRAEKEDFRLLASEDDEIEQRKQIVSKANQELSVFKIIFKENYKWEFFYQGIKIFATIKDQTFFKKIEKGEIAFRSGDKLIVDIEIEQVFNESANTFENKSYHIIHVKEHMPRTTLIQNTFGFE